jgi:hypothetical protein
VLGTLLRSLAQPVSKQQIYQVKKITAEKHDCREKVRPGTGRETGLGHAGAITERAQRKQRTNKQYVIPAQAGIH